MRLKPELKGALLALSGVALVLVVIWIYMGARLGVWTYREYERYVWLSANLPVAHALWHGEIKAGDNIEQIITMWNSHWTTRFGQWVKLDWVPGGPNTNGISLIGVNIVGKNGVIVCASAYSDDFVGNRLFFNTLSPAEEAEYGAAHKAYLAGLQAKREKEAKQAGITNGLGAIRSLQNAP